jgi:hypothetical protein
VGVFEIYWAWRPTARRNLRSRGRISDLLGVEIHCSKEFTFAWEKIFFDPKGGLLGVEIHWAKEFIFAWARFFFGSPGEISCE